MVPLRGDGSSWRKSSIRLILGWLNKQTNDPPGPRALAGLLFPGEERRCQHPYAYSGVAESLMIRARPVAAMANRISVTILALAATLIQCYATRTGDSCATLSVHATMAECRKLASEYQKFDTRDLRVKGVPAVVSYHCVTGNAPRSDR
jgi:hypothetical protein